MSQMKHTPGPWILQGPLKKPTRWAIEAGTWTFYAGGPHGEANASLIATSPELLAELERIVSKYVPVNSEDFSPLVALLKKAKGR